MDLLRGEGLEPDEADEYRAALLASSQAQVTGFAHCVLRPGSVFVTGVESPHSLMAASRGQYGESAGEWTAADAVGFSRLMALPGLLQTRARGEGKEG